MPLRPLWLFVSSPRFVRLAAALFFIIQGLLQLVWLRHMADKAYRYNAQGMVEAIVAYERSPTAENEAAVRQASGLAWSRAMRANLPAFTSLFLGDALIAAFWIAHVRRARRGPLRLYIG